MLCRGRLPCVVSLQCQWYENLFQAPQGDAMILFMWRDDIIGVAQFNDACLERVHTRVTACATQHFKMR